MAAASAAAAFGRPPRIGKGTGPWLGFAASAAVAALLPVAGLAAFALRGWGRSGGEWANLVDNVLPEALRVTVLLLAGVGLVTFVIGVGTAWLVTAYDFPGRRWLSWALLLPLAVPTYIVAYAYLDILHPIGPVQTAIRAALGIARPRDLRLPDIRSLGGAVLLLGLVLYPYVYLPVRALFQMQSANAVEVARTLGAGRWRVFWQVALPLSRPAVAIGLSLALMETLNDVGASEFLGVRTLTVAVYTTWTVRMSVEGAAQIALLMLAVVFALILVERRARRRSVFVSQGRRPRAPTPMRMSGPGAILSTLACALPVALGFAAPAAYLVVQTWRRVGLAGWPADLGQWVGNSVALSLAATVAAVLVGLALAFAARLAPERGGPLVRIAGIGYAIPGTVLAVGLLVPLAGFDNALDAAMRAQFGISTGLILTGSGTALVLAYVLRFLTISVGGLEAGFAKVSPNLDRAARSLGASPLRLLGRVHLPLLTPSAIAAALLVFVDCMKELPATLLLQPFNVQTLATALYGEAKRGTYEDGAVAALAIVLVGLIPVMLLGRVQAARGVQERSASSPS